MAVKQKKWNKKEQDETQKAGVDGAEMSFEEIAEALNLTVPQVKMIYVRAMKKLKVPNEVNRQLWEYDNIGSSSNNSDMAAHSL